MPSWRLIIKLVGVAAIFTFIIAYLSTVTYKSEIIVNGKVFEVQVADTNYLLEKGLSGREPLLDNQGMFFIFEKPDKYGFWMKEMKFPIDIIWIDHNFQIIHIEKSVKPDTYPKIFYPESKASYVLEISAGESLKANLKIGDTVKFIKKSGQRVFNLGLS